MPRKFADIDSKIISIFERFSQILRVLYWNVAKEEGLSPIQIQFVLYLSRHPLVQRKVSILAEEFSLTQATVSDAISSLEEKKIVLRVPSKEDGRACVLELTPKGKKLSKRLSLWADSLKTCLKGCTNNKKESAMIVMMELIKSMQEEGVIGNTRMCLTCGHFLKNAHPDSEKPHHCNLTNVPLSISDLNINCLTHKENTL